MASTTEERITPIPEVPRALLAEFPKGAIVWRLDGKTGPSMFALEHATFLTGKRYGTIEVVLERLLQLPTGAQRVIERNRGRISVRGIVWDDARKTTCTIYGAGAISWPFQGLNIEIRTYDPRRRTGIAIVYRGEKVSRQPHNSTVRFGPWTTLNQIEAGALFQFRDSKDMAVMSEYFCNPDTPERYPECIIVGSGCAMGPQCGPDTIVREVILPGN